MQRPLQTGISTPKVAKPSTASPVFSETDCCQARSCVLRAGRRKMIRIVWEPEGNVLLMCAGVAYTNSTRICLWVCICFRKRNIIHTFLSILKKLENKSLCTCKNIKTSPSEFPWGFRTFHFARALPLENGKNKQ